MLTIDIKMRSAIGLTMHDALLILEVLYHMELAEDN